MQHVGGHHHKQQFHKNLLNIQKKTINLDSGSALKAFRPHSVQWISRKKQEKDAAGMVPIKLSETRSELPAIHINNQFTQ